MSLLLLLFGFILGGLFTRAFFPPLDTKRLDKLNRLRAPLEFADPTGPWCVTLRGCEDHDTVRSAIDWALEDA